MPDPDPPFHPSCWAFIRDSWHKGRVLSDPENPIPGSRLGPGWGPEDGLMVHTWDGLYQAVPVSCVRIVAEGDPLGDPPSDPPEGWEAPEVPDFLR